MRWLYILVGMVFYAGAVQAQVNGRGPVTNLPMPRYISVKGAEAYLRRGPAQTHRIDWIFRHRGTPLQVTAEFGAWRRVTDMDGISGWVHSVVLSRVRNVVVSTEQISLFQDPNSDAVVIAKVNHGVIARLLNCRIEWCQVQTGGYLGWVSKSGIWGVDPDEVFE